MNVVSSLSKLELLDRAKKHYFSLGVDDGAARLCKANFRYGLAKIHYTQEQLGLEPNATFVSTPDETISRNVTRWTSGYGYGGKLTTSKKEASLLFIDVKPNACGMLVGGIEELPSPQTIIQNINNVMNTELYIDNIKIQWDYKASNHFIDVFETLPSKHTEKHFPKYMFIIHGSIPELRQETEKGPGLYYDKSKTLGELCKKMQTPFGDTWYLDGNDAKDYLEFFLYAKKLAARKRIKAAELLFGKFQTISNPMHQGLLSCGEMLLGAQHITEEPEKLFPVALKSDKPAYLITAEPNLREEQIDALGFENRAKKLGVFAHLTELNVLPHGGGYKLPHINRVKRVLELEGKRYFINEQEEEDAFTIFADVASCEFTYRGKSVINRIMDLEMGTIEAKLQPRFVLKV